MMDFRPDRADFRSEGADFRSERADFRSNSCKSIRWAAVPVPCLSRLWLKLRGEQGSGLGVEIWALRVGLGSQDWDLGLETGI